ncbi:MAG: cytochrome c biogenesis protein CcsA [Armatimonadetes bacterium]|nr:cytochrome c biogenesis protein CcsA [Armatimonadota bacterium]MDW8121340.1 cytochrome c biogenesis protein CcsA [Armatimonadota bacterium]
MSFHWWQIGWVVGILYLLLSGLIHWALWKGKRALPVSARSLTFALFVVHSILLGALWLIKGLSPDSPEELALILSWLIVGVVLIQWMKQELEAPSAFAMPIAGILIAFGATGNDVSRLPPHLSRELLALHITLLMAAYLLLMLAFSSAVAYLLTRAFLKRKRPLSLLQRLPPLEVTDQMTRRWVLFGLPFLIAGMLVGFLWAKAEGRSAWSDPKVSLSVLTLLLFLGYLHGRWVRRWEPTIAHIFIIVGCGALLITFLVAQHTLAL